MSRTQDELVARRDELRERAARSAEANGPDAARVVHKAILAVLDFPSHDFKRLLRTVVAAEKLLHLAERVRVQGQLVGNGLLPFSQVAAHGGYSDALRAIRSLGVRPEEGGRPPAPVVLLEPMASPATYVRGAMARSPGFGGSGDDVLPFPLVLVPPYPSTSLGSLCLVQHEVGHNIDQDHRLTSTLAPRLVTALESAGFSAQAADTWASWTREMVADVFGVLLGNVALPIELAGWANALGDADAMGTQTHPYPSLRVGLAVRVLRTFAVDLQALGIETHVQVVAASRTASVKAFEAALPVVTRTLLETPLPTLHGGALRDLAPDLASEAQMLVNAATILPCFPAEPVPAGPMPSRLLPSLARVAVALGGPADQIAHALTHHALRRHDEVDRAFSHAIFDQTVLRLARPPILDEEHEGLKRPPATLFEPARSIAFVGASNDSLPHLFDAYEGDRKDSVEVFYLTDAAVRTLAHPGRSAVDLARGRAASLDALLSGKLSRVANGWTIYEHDAPFFFAAYWDAHRPGGRIHTSSHGWGQDVKRAPAVDFVWPVADPVPTRRYRWYLDALDGLLRTAHRLACSPAR